MKVTVIGSGSIFFTRQMAMGMAESKYLRSAELVLVDIDEEKCVQMGKFCQKVNEEFGGNMKVSYTTDRCEALPGSDYVILSYALRNYHYRETGTILSLNYDIKLRSGETAGPSAVFRIIRTVPKILEVTMDIERLCPNARVINYVNPTNVIATLLDRHTKVKWYSFCDGMYEPQHTFDKIVKYAGIDKKVKDISQLEAKIGGINHFAWMYDLKFQGKSVWNEFCKNLSKAAKENGMDSNEQAEWELTEIFDAWPTNITHNIEYVRYFQGKGSKPERDYQTEKWSLNDRIRWMKNVWYEIEACNNGKKSTKTLMEDESTDMIAALIESIEGNLGRTFPVNLRNEGRISNLPDDLIVELFGKFGKDGITVPGIGDLPRGPLGLTHQVIDEQELALEAALTGNYHTLVKAIACDPTVMSMSDAKDLARDLIAIEEDDIDEKWRKYWEIV